MAPRTTVDRHTDLGVLQSSLNASEYTTNKTRLWGKRNTAPPKIPQISDSPKMSSGTNSMLGISRYCSGRVVTTTSTVLITLAATRPTTIPSSAARNASTTFCLTFISAQVFYRNFARHKFENQREDGKHYG